MHKIAISGAHGVGKTTLASALSEKLGLPLIREVAREVAQNFGFKTTEEIWRANSGKKALYQLNVFYSQIEAEKSHAYGFVSDRSIFDSIAYSLFYGLNAVAEYLIDEAASHSENYELIVYCPIPDFDSPANDGFRLTDKESQMQVDEILRGLLRWARCPVLRLSPDRDAWLEQVLDYLDRATAPVPV